MAASQRVTRKRFLREIVSNSNDSDSDFSSDDSLIDKDYVASSESSGSEAIDDVTVSFILVVAYALFTKLHDGLCLF